MQISPHEIEKQAQPTIRRARAHEVAKLTQLAIAAKAYWPYPPELIEKWRAALAIDVALIESQPAYVAQLGNELAGFYVLDTDAGEAPGTWALRDLWVLPRHIGSGIGRLLLRHACALAGGHGVVSLTIDADPYAEAFYLARGARRVGQMAAPIQDQPGRVRPQLRLAVAALR